jgi:hypothetical protein
MVMDALLPFSRSGDGVRRQYGACRTRLLKSEDNAESYSEWDCTRGRPYASAHEYLDSRNSFVHDHGEAGHSTPHTRHAPSRRNGERTGRSANDGAEGKEDLRARWRQQERWKKV